MMNTLVSRHLLNKTLAVAIASASLLVTLPSVEVAHAAPKPAATKPAATPGQTIVDIASNPKAPFKTLVAAVKAAGLVDTLSSPEPFTVFAPTDAAFAALPKGTLEKLLQPENKATLVKILTYHAVPGIIYSKDIKRSAVKTVEGSPLNVNVKKSNVYVGRARVIKADIKTSNGVIHVINQVLLPPDVKIP